MDNNKNAILIKKLALEFDKIAIPELAPYNLTPTQFKVIKYLLLNQEKEVTRKKYRKSIFYDKSNSNWNFAKS